VNCKFDTSQCVPAECGNGVLGPSEDCEVGSPAVNCSTLAAGFGTAQCGPGCTYDTSTCSADRFVDNNNGTVSDFQTGLVWEKKVAGSSGGNDSQGVGDCLHCVGDVYNWTTGMSEWISAVNGRTDDPSSQTGFANHTDWRLPTVVELQTIIDGNAEGCGEGSPCIDPIFGPTGASYRSTSTFASNPADAWVVFFDFFGVFNAGFFDKADDYHVRAVRTGP
jgi:hypothetical protein